MKQNIFDDIQLDISISDKIYEQLYKSVADFIYEFHTSACVDLKKIKGAELNYITDNEYAITKQDNSYITIQFNDDSVILHYNDSYIFSRAGIVKLMNDLYEKFKLFIDNISVDCNGSYRHAYPHIYYKDDSEYMINHHINSEICNHFPKFNFNSDNENYLFSYLSFKTDNDFKNFFKSFFEANKNISYVYIQKKFIYVNGITITQISDDKFENIIGKHYPLTKSIIQETRGEMCRIYRTEALM